MLSACRVDTRVDLVVRADGSGGVGVTVVLDREAVAEIGDLASELRIADLQATGWEVEGPVEIDDGAWQVHAAKPFGTVEEAERVLAEVGPPVGGLRVDRGRSFLRTTTTVEGVLDLAGGLAAFGDAELTESLGGLPFGVDDAELERRIGSPPADAVGFEVAARLPGDDDRAVWSPRLGEQLAVEADAQRLNRINIGAAVLAFLFAAAFVASWRRR